MYKFFIIKNVLITPLPCLTELFKYLLSIDDTIALSSNSSMIRTTKITNEDILYATVKFGPVLYEIQESELSKETAWDKNLLD